MAVRSGPAILHNDGRRHRAAAICSGEVLVWQRDQVRSAKASGAGRSGACPPCAWRQLGRWGRRIPSRPPGVLASAP